MMKTSSLPMRLAAALLLQEGELSIGDIRALPFVDDPETARAVATSLMSVFQAEWRQRKTISQGISYWEDYVYLLTSSVSDAESEFERDSLTREEFEDILRKVSGPFAPRSG